MSDACALYRMYDGEENLLYIGISVSPITRTGQHYSEKEWFREVCLIELEWFDDVKSAQQAESIAIRRERPMHNIISAAKPRYRRETALVKVISFAESQDRLAEEVITSLQHIVLCVPNLGVLGYD